MAFSKSLQKGQYALSCQMCEESSEIKWKCLTCDSFMCSKCCKIHRKVKSSDKHNIIDIKDLAFQTAEPETMPDFTNINCIQHKDQKCCLYCKVCEEVVCPICIAKFHSEHKMVEISEGYQVSLSKIKDMNTEVEGDIFKFTSDVSKLDSIRSAERSNYMVQKQKILSHEKAVKDAVEKHTKKLLGDLDQKWKILESSLQAEETCAVKVTNDLEAENRILICAKDSKNAHEVFKMASERRKLKRQSPKRVNTKYQRLPRFVPGEINPSSVESIHGTLEEIKELSMTQKVQIQVKEQYITTFPCVDALVCCDDGSMWISDVINKIIQNVKLSNGSIHVNKTFSIKSPSMAITSSGDLLLATWDTHLQVTPHTTGTVKESKISVSPLRTTAVHVSDNKIIVGTKESGPTFPASGPRQVVVMNMEGRHEHVYHYDNKRKPLFTCSYKITTDKDNNIYVIDLISDDRNGRVVVLEHGGGVMGIYSGHTDINDIKHLFKPKDIVTTPSDNVIVSDYQTHTLHILNNNVQCVQYLNTKHSEIIWPMSLYFDNMGSLFIGCGTGVNDPDNANIFVVQLVNEY